MDGIEEKYGVFFSVDFLVLLFWYLDADLLLGWLCLDDTVIRFRRTWIGFD